SARRASVWRTSWPSGPATSPRSTPRTSSPTPARKGGDSVVPSEGRGEIPAPLFFRGGRWMRSLRILTIGAGCLSAAPALAEEPQLLDPSDARSLDPHNADAYCDAISGIAIAPTGDDAGSVPASPEALWCARSVAKNVTKLAQAVLRCHAKMAYMFFAG